MAQYDLHESDDPDTLLLDVQSDILSGYENRIVIPVQRPHIAPIVAKRLNPVVAVAGEPHVLVTQFLAAVPLEALGARVTSLSERHLEITDAVDFLLHGY